MRTGELGFWWRSLSGLPPRRAPLPEPREADVAIVGAGYTGLWTAYYLKRARPSLEVVVLEAEHAGFGASARNGGWLTADFSGPPRAYERGRAAGSFRELQRAMRATIDEVAGVLEHERIDAELMRGGQLSVALDSAQAARLRDQLISGSEQATDEGGTRLLDARELTTRVRIDGAELASFTPHAARVHPAKLLVGLAEAVERLGVPIYEGTPVSQLAAHEARTPMGLVRARWVVRATEGYTASLRGLRRALVPMNSSMIVTEPLSQEAWEEIGWRGGEVLGDCAHVFVYLQRTADGRIAIGGRGVPYRFGSRTDGEGQTARATIEQLRAKLVSMFPATEGVAIDHAWSGVLGVARDWCVSVDADPDTGLARAGGYVGEGVAASNLAARALCEQLLGEPGELKRLAWVGREPRRWEPEPLRWCAIRGVYALYRAADAREHRSGRSSRLASIVDAASGRR
ncbi:MAG TPA: FAD-binding oxidoreductase [Solirubrobacteraceae bacterium]|nr:FAD-binding oxidoreductase [Solirubrobacteraceae bacterium]